MPLIFNATWSRSEMGILENVQKKRSAPIASGRTNSCSSLDKMLIQLGDQNVPNISRQKMTI